MFDRVESSVDRRSHQLCAVLLLDEMIHIAPRDLAQKADERLAPDTLPVIEPAVEAERRLVVREFQTCSYSAEISLPV